MLDNFLNFASYLDMPVSSSSLIFEEQVELEDLEPGGKHQFSTETCHIITMFIFV